MMTRNVVPPQEQTAGIIADSDASDEEHLDIDTENPVLKATRFRCLNPKLQIRRGHYETNA